MAYWLIKSEPDEFSWDDLVATKARGEPWSGVRNHQAKNNLMAMKVGDRAFFYHSKTGLEIVGIAEVKRTAYPDPMAPSSSPWMEKPGIRFTMSSAVCGLYCAKSAGA